MYICVATFHSSSTWICFFFFNPVILKDTALNYLSRVKIYFATTLQWHVKFPQDCSRVSLLLRVPPSANTMEKSVFLSLSSQDMAGLIPTQVFQNFGRQCTSGKDQLSLGAITVLTTVCNLFLMVMWMRKWHQRFSNISGDQQQVKCQFLANCTFKYQSDIKQHLRNRTGVRMKLLPFERKNK